MAAEGAAEEDAERGPRASVGPSPVAPAMGWGRAGLIGLAVFVYFAVATTWLPSKLLRLDSVASSAAWLQNVVVTGSWLGGLAIGLVGLRRAQARGWI